jgi:uncharacterized membrane protein
MRQPKHALVIWFVVKVVGLCAAFGLGLPAATVQAQSNPIVVENQQPGTDQWRITWGHAGNDVAGQIKGYASATSVNKGESLTFQVSVNPVQTYTIDVYRIGWCQGLGGRLMQHIGPLTGAPQAPCPTDSTTGMTECQWMPSYVLATQTSWTSGIYLALLTNAAGYQNYIVFAVRDDSRTAALLYKQPVTTYQAYNDYPYDTATGKSLYDFNSYGANTVAGTKRAVKVSFDRPYLGDGDGADWGHFFLFAEVNFIRWMEMSGYDVTYATDVDVHANGRVLLNYRGMLSVGHDEYWSKQIYDAVVAARDAGVNLAFLGANPVGWQARYEASSSGVPNRVVVCYRDAALDPVADPSLKTVNWRVAPLNRPEQTLVGVQYTNMVLWRSQYQGYAPHVVMNSGNWVYAGTGFRDGDSVPGIVGYEADRLFSEFPGPNAASGTYTLLSNSPFTSNKNTPDYSNASVYQASSGAWVFASGSMGWNWGLDNYGGWNVVDARIQRTTANVLDRFVAAGTPADFTLSASPSSQTATAGGSTTFGITIGPTGGFTGQVTLSVSGLPGGATGSFSPNPATASSTLSVATSASTPIGTYPLTIAGGSGSLTHTTTVTLVVTAPADFTLSASPSSQTTPAGGSTSYGVAINPANGFAGQVTLGVSGLPGGATGSFTPNPATASSTLSVATSASTPVGTYALTITGVSGSLTRTTTVTLVVTAPADFTLSASPSSRTVLAGDSTTYGVAINAANGFAGQVTLSLSGLPGGATGSFTPNPATASSTLSVATSASTAAGTYTLTLTGVSGSLTRTTAVTLVVTAPPDFTLSASPSSQAVLAGSSTTYSVTINPANGFNGQVTLSVSGLPGDATGSFTPNPATATSTLSVATSVSTPAGSYTLTITGVSGSLTRTTSITLVVSDFTLSASPSSQMVTAGGSTTYSVTISPTNGFTGQVTLSVSGLPSDASGSFTPNPATVSATLSVATSPSTAAGTYTLTITGVSGSLTRTTTVTLVVSDFTLSASPSTQTVLAGGSTSYVVAINPTNGFTGQVTLSVSGLPGGATGSFAPNPATASSTLSVTTSASTPGGTFTLTVTGVSGALTRTTTVALTVRRVTFDSAVSSGIQWGVTTVTTPSFVVGNGTNRAAMIMVALSVNDTTNISASLGGVSGTLVPGTDSGTTASIRTLIFQVINPPSGSHAATVSWTNGLLEFGVNADVGVITVSGVDQTTPITGGTFAGSNSSPAAATSVTITSSPGDLTASVGYTANGWVAPFTNQTLKWGVDSGAVGGDIGPGAGTTTHTWTDQYLWQTHAVSGANFKAAATP